MDCFLLSLRLIFAWINLQLYVNTSDGFKWISRPSNKTLAHVGSTVHITWHYTCNYRFGLSNIYYNGATMFYRFINEQNYSHLKNVDAHFSVIGGWNVTIIIPDVDEDKHGSYCCKVNCDGLLYKKCTTLVIYDLPRINYLTSNLYGKQGDWITLKCNASGYGAPRVRWIHKDTNTTIAHSSLTSFNITGKASGGKYCCHVSNDYGNGTNCTTLEVTEYQPINTKLTSNVKFAVKNMTIRVSCKADAFPPATYFIKQGNKTILNSSDGNVTITTPDNGTSLIISCVAKNKYGEGKVVYMQIPIFDKPEIDNCLSSRNNISSFSGHTIHLRCVARGVPVPNITWHASDGKILSAGTTSYPGGSELTLTLTRKQDYGMYRCRALNIIGVAWHHITVMQICQCKGNYEKYKTSADRTRRTIKEPVNVIFLTWLSLTIVSGIVNILLIIYIKSRKHQKRKEPFSAKRNRNQSVDDAPRYDPWNRTICI